MTGTAWPGQEVGQTRLKPDLAKTSLVLTAAAHAVLVGCNKGQGQELAFVEHLLSACISSFHHIYHQCHFTDEEMRCRVARGRAQGHIAGEQDER